MTSSSFSSEFAGSERCARSKISIRLRRHLIGEWNAQASTANAVAVRLEQFSRWATHNSRFSKTGEWTERICTSRVGILLRISVDWQGLVCFLGCRDQEWEDLALVLSLVWQWWVAWRRWGFAWSIFSIQLRDVRLTLIIVTSHLSLTQCTGRRSWQIPERLCRNTRIPYGRCQFEEANT